MSFSDTIFQWLPKLRRPDGSLADGQCDPAGNLKVAVVASIGGATSWVDPDRAKVLTNARTIAALGGRKLHALLGSNEGTVARWLMIFDLATLPPTGSAPALARPVAPHEPFHLALARPRTFASGITWAVSTAADVYAEDIGALFRIHAEVE